MVVEVLNLVYLAISHSKGFLKITSYLVQVLKLQRMIIKFSIKLIVTGVQDLQVLF